MKLSLHCIYRLKGLIRLHNLHSLTVDPSIGSTDLLSGLFLEQQPSATIEVSLGPTASSKTTSPCHTHIAYKPLYTHMSQMPLSPLLTLQPELVFSSSINGKESSNEWQDIISQSFCGFFLTDAISKKRSLSSLATQTLTQKSWCLDASRSISFGATENKGEMDFSRMQWNVTGKAAARDARLRGCLLGLGCYTLATLVTLLLHLCVHWKSGFRLVRTYVRRCECLMTKEEPPLTFKFKIQG